MNASTAAPLSEQEADANLLVCVCASAYHIENQQAGVKLSGHSGQKTSFSGKSIFVKQSGFAMLSVLVPGQSEPEKYLITLPKLRSVTTISDSKYSCARAREADTKVIPIPTHRIDGILLGS